MIHLLGSIDPATWATVAAGVGSAAAGLGGKWFGHRSAVRQVESGAVERIAGAYGEALDDLQSQLRESRADRAVLHDRLAEIEAQQKVERGERRVLVDRFADLLEHVRVLRTILRANAIDHPPGPPFLDESG